MSYQVLARKYRPQNFSEVIGQDHVFAGRGVSEADAAGNRTRCVSAHRPMTRKLGIGEREQMIEVFSG